MFGQLSAKPYVVTVVLQTGEQADLRVVAYDTQEAIMAAAVEAAVAELKVAKVLRVRPDEAALHERASLKQAIDALSQWRPPEPPEGKAQ